MNLIYFVFLFYRISLNSYFRSGLTNSKIHLKFLQNSGALNYLKGFQLNRKENRNPYCSTRLAPTIAFGLDQLLGQFGLGL
jgi:hypothetical protein